MRFSLPTALAKRPNEIINLPWKAGGGMRKGTTPGYFFCATIGKRTYLRFITADAALRPTGEIIPEIGTCLRLIECTVDVPVVEDGALHQSIFDAWERAKASIFAAWTYETEPANLLPKIRPLNRQVSQFLRTNQPSDVPQEKFSRVMDILKAPWPRREENMLRESYERESESAKTKAVRLIEEIDAIGLEPFRPPEPLPPIEETDVHLTCWLVVYSIPAT
jgi:hypothetical protein